MQPAFSLKSTVCDPLGSAHALWCKSYATLTGPVTILRKFVMPYSVLTAELVRQSPDEPPGPYLWQEVVTPKGDLSHYVLIHTTFAKHDKKTAHAAQKGVKDFTFFNVCTHLTIIPAEISVLAFLRYDFPRIIRHAVQYTAAQHGMQPTSR